MIGYKVAICRETDITRTDNNKKKKSVYYYTVQPYIHSLTRSLTRSLFVPSRNVEKDNVTKSCQHRVPFFSTKPRRKDASWPLQRSLPSRLHSSGSINGYNKSTNRQGSVIILNLITSIICAVTHAGLYAWMTFLSRPLVYSRSSLCVHFFPFSIQFHFFLFPDLFLYFFNFPEFQKNAKRVN